MNTPSMSNELQLYRVNNGITLRKPVGVKQSVSSILKLPMAIYFENRTGVIQKANAINAEICCGFDSPEQSVGKKYYMFLNKNVANQLLKNDARVIQTNRRMLFEESMVQETGLTLSTLSIKLPWYNSHNKIVGLFGCSIVLGQSPLAESLHHISNLGILAPNEDISKVIGKETNNIYLSKRQIECAKLLLQGMKVKQIAAYLNLSPRTIETYLDNIKIKLNCQNRTELIIKLSDYVDEKSMM